MLREKRCFLLVFITGLIFFTSWSYAQDWKGKGRIEGIVLGEGGEPIANAKVTFTHLRLQATFTKTTNEKGVFKAAWIKGGRWNVDVHADGYLPRKLVAQVSEIIQNIPMEIYLKKTEKTVVEEELRETVKTLLNEGNTLFEQKKYEDALVKFKEILEKVPELFQINLNIGNCYYEMGDFDSAIPYYQAVLDKEPENKDALISLSNVYLEKGELDKGMELLNKLSAEDVTSPLTLYNVGTLLFNKGKPEAAVQYYEQAVRLDQSMADAYYQLGLCYLSTDDREKSKQSFLKYLELEPDSEKKEQVEAFLKFLEKKD